MAFLVEGSLEVTCIKNLQEKNRGIMRHLPVLIGRMLPHMLPPKIPRRGARYPPGARANHTEADTPLFHVPVCN